MDVVVAALVFISAITVFIVLITSDLTGNIGDLKTEAKKVPDLLLSQGKASLSDGDKIDVGRIRELQNSDYEDIKAYLAIESDFCIYFEDGEGNLINLSKVTGVTGAGGSVGIGSEEVILNRENDVRCFKS